MANRKSTPDVLSEILGGEPEARPPSAGTQPRSEPKAPSRRRPPAEAPSRPARPRQVSWEYMEVVFRDYGGYRPRCVNGQELKGWKGGPTIREYLNQLGADGWELAGVGSRESGEMPAYLKRLRS